jgi:transposase
MTEEEEIAELEAENAAVREQVGALLDRVQEREGRPAKDSHNSSKPPSNARPSDAVKRKTKSLRQKSGKKAGEQLGVMGRRCIR